MAVIIPQVVQKQKKAGFFEVFGGIIASALGQVPGIAAKALAGAETGGAEGAVVGGIKETATPTVGAAGAKETVQKVVTPPPKPEIPQSQFAQATPGALGRRANALSISNVDQQVLKEANRAAQTLPQSQRRRVQSQFNPLLRRS